MAVALALFNYPPPRLWSGRLPVRASSATPCSCLRVVRGLRRILGTSCDHLALSTPATTCSLLPYQQVACKTKTGHVSPAGRTTGSALPKVPASRAARHRFRVVDRCQAVVRFANLPLPSPSPQGSPTTPRAVDRWTDGGRKTTGSSRTRPVAPLARRRSMVLALGAARHRFRCGSRRWSARLPVSNAIPQLPAVISWLPRTVNVVRRRRIVNFRLRMLQERVGNRSSHVAAIRPRGSVRPSRGCRCRRRARRQL